MFLGSLLFLLLINMTFDFSQLKDIFFCFLAHRVIFFISMFMMFSALLLDSPLVARMRSSAKAMTLVCLLY